MSELKHCESCDDDQCCECCDFNYLLEEDLAKLEKESA